jgi:hypothetical protein
MPFFHCKSLSKMPRGAEYRRNAPLASAVARRPAKPALPRRESRSQCPTPPPVETCAMNQTMLPLIHKAPVQGLQVHVVRSGLALGDELEAVALDDGTIGIVARIRARFLGLIPHHRLALIGRFGPQATGLLLPELDRGESLRLRIVGLTPEFLAGPGGAEVHVSVWVRA